LHGLKRAHVRAKESAHTVVVCGGTLGAPLFRREILYTGCQMANLCGKNAAADPLLPREATLCKKEDPSSTQVAARV